MTSRTFKARLLTVVLALVAAFPFCHAQDTPMAALVGESLSKLRPDSPAEAYITCIAELKRIDAMYPGNAAPQYCIALESLNYAVMNPQAEGTEHFIAEASEAITRLEELPEADPSDLHTLKGFLYMVRIVQDPANNGRRYYLDVMDSFEKALQLNPENETARLLQQKFREGMNSR